MKGQAINIDWSTGLALFLVTILSSVVFLIDPLTVQNQNSLDNKAMDVQNILQREGGRTNHRNTFYIQSPEEIENVPFDQKYFYSNLLGTGIAEEPSYLNVPANRFATVTDTGNSSIDMTYFSGDLEPPSYYSDLEVSSSEISNSEITVQYGSSIESVTIGGEEAISSINIDGSTDTSQNDVFVEMFSGNLKVFNDSREFIVQDNSFTVRTRNYSTLYWHPEGNQSTSGTGTLKSGNTRGLTLADSDLGVTFLGDLDANVSRPDSSSLKVEIDAPETRIRAHNSGTGYGERRIEAFNSTETFFGAEKIRRSLFREDLETVANMSERDFETRFGLENWGYNVTVVDEEENNWILSRGQQIAFRDTSISRRMVSFIDSSGKVKQAESRVVLWR